MADGLLGGYGDGLDPAEIQKWMAQFGATEQDKKDANKQAMFALGFGLLGGRKGNELATIGQAGMGAMNAQQGYLQNVTKERGANIGQAINAMKASKDIQATNLGMGLLRGDQPSGATPAMPTPQFGMNDRSMGAPDPASIATQGAPQSAPAQPGGNAGWANPRNELAFSIMGKKDIADVLHRQYQITQGPSGTLMRNGQIVGQVIPNAGMIIDGQFQALPKEATDALANFEGAKTTATEKAKAPYDMVQAPVGNNQTTLMSKADYLAAQKGMNFQGTPEFVAKAREIAMADASGQSPIGPNIKTPPGGAPQPAGAMGGFGTTANPLAVKQAEANIDTKAQADRAQGNEIAKNYGQVYNDAVMSEYNAPTKIAKLNQLRGYLGQINTGKTEGAILNLKAYAADVAPNLTKEWTKDVPYAQAAKQLSAEMALQLRNPAGGAGMPGSLSDNDLKFLNSMIPAVEQDPRTIPMAIDAKIALENRSKEIGKMAREYKKSNGQIDEGFFQHVQEFANSHPLFAGVGGAAAPGASAPTAAPTAAEIAAEMKRRGLK